MVIKTQYNKHIIGITAVFCLIVFGLVSFMNLKNTWDLQAILENSVKSQLTSISYAAQEVIDIEKFMTYNSNEDKDADLENYNATLRQLRALCTNTGAEYIYLLKKLDDGRVVFVFDTDPEDEEVFIEYDIEEVHAEAFEGKESAGVLNLVDEYGSYNTGAIPIWYNGRVVGIIAVDIEDHHIRASQQQATINAIVLSVLLVLTMGIMLWGMSRMMKRIRKMYAKLEWDAHYDAVTGLPNRKHLIEYLDHMVTESPDLPFALLFIDLDNFKHVNDTAGHDAGDELLRHIAEYLNHTTENTVSFRPSAGQLNIAARIGGDEFIQVVQGVETEEQAAGLAKNLLDGFTKYGDDRFIKKYNVGMSIGVALYPYHSDNYHVLIKYADLAMYHSKRAGKNTYNIYNDEMEAKDEK